MSTSPSRPKGAPTKPKKERERERERERKEKALQQSTERLKTVVRRLPPNLPEDVFWQSVQPWVTEESVSWKVFYAGKARKRSVFFLTLHSLLQSLILGLEIDYRRRISPHELTSRSRLRRSSPNLAGNTMVICFEIKQVRVHVIAFYWTGVYGRNWCQAMSRMRS